MVISKGTQRFICGRRALVPQALVATVLKLANAENAPYLYVPTDVSATLLCSIQTHRGPVHYGAALNLRGPEAGTVWALWRDGVEPSAGLVIPDCPARRHGDACSEFSGHPGAHSWDLADPPHPEPCFPLPLLSSPHVHTNGKPAR